MRLIQCSGKKHPNTFIMVDDADYEWLNQWKWWVGGHHGILYAGGAYGLHKGKKYVKMHRLIMGEPLGLYVDHIDGNGLNNQRENLRVCSASNNNKNMKKHVNGVTSRHKGVHRERNKFRAAIRCNYRRINLGVFPDEDSAARAYNRAALEYHGEFAKLNDVGDA